MATELSKFALNTFDSATERNNSLMGELLAVGLPMATAATAGNMAFAGPLSALGMQAGAWNGSAMAVNNARAVLKGRTFAFTDKMASITRKPDADTKSPIGDWEHVVNGVTAPGSALYITLLPNGRETITAGTYDEQLDAMDGFSSRLAEQTTKPALITLSATVATFAGAARTLRDLQSTAKGVLDSTRLTLEERRQGCAAAYFALVGCGMMEWKDTPARVDTLFDLSLLRNPVQDVPDAPADTTWTPATRMLSTTVMPERGSRLEAWRIAPGGMPEQLHTGNPKEPFVQIPTTITWVSGGLYQIWLVAINGKGESDPGPVQSWTAP